MPSYTSHEGKWYPAKERIALKNKSDKPFEYKGQTINPGDDFIYEGGDREALKELALAGEEYFGRNFKNDPDFLQAVRNMNFKNVDEYLENIGYDQEAVDKQFEETAEVVNRHELPKQVEAINVMGGGKDFSGSGKDMKGGWKEPPAL